MIYHPRVHFGDVGEFPLKKTIMVTSASEVAFFFEPLGAFFGPEFSPMLAPKFWNPAKMAKTVALQLDQLDPLRSGAPRVPVRSSQ